MSTNIVRPAPSECGKYRDSVAELFNLHSRDQNAGNIAAKDKLIRLTTKDGRLDLSIVNCADDNILHELVRLCSDHPEREAEILELLKLLEDDELSHSAFKDVEAKHTGTVKSKDTERKLKEEAMKKSQLLKRSKNALMKEKNKEDLTPLQLAFQLKIFKVFELLMIHEPYCFRNEEEGLFDITEYDVTDIDTATLSDYNSRAIIKDIHKQDPDVAYNLVQLDFIRFVLKGKWKRYKRIVYVWMVFHIVFMGFLSWSAIERAEMSSNQSRVGANDFDNMVPGSEFVTAYGAIDIVVGVFYLLFGVIGLASCCRSWCQNTEGVRDALSNLPQRPHGNVLYTMVFGVFSISLILDFILTVFSEGYENYLLIVAILSGYFSFLFFLRAFRVFSVLTVLIHNVLFGDMFRVSVIIAVQLIAFTCALYMALQGENTSDVNYTEYGRMMFVLFRTMLGLSGIEDPYAARQPTLVIIIYVGYMVLTITLMFNALIALISTTTESLTGDWGQGRITASEKHWRLQVLSLILYIESLLPLSYLKQSGKAKEREGFTLTEETTEERDLTEKKEKERELMFAKVKIPVIVVKNKVSPHDWTGGSLYGELVKKLKKEVKATSAAIYLHTETTSSWSRDDDDQQDSVNPYSTTAILEIKNRFNKCPDCRKKRLCKGKII